MVLSTEFGMFRGCSQDSEARSYSYAYPHYTKCDESSYCQDKAPYYSQSRARSAEHRPAKPSIFPRSTGIGLLAVSAAAAT